MNENIKQKWISNLTSGNYQKAKYGLRYQKVDGTCSFCALGVLVDMYINTHDNCHWSNVGPVINGVQHSNGILPAPVAKWSKCKSGGGYLTIFGSIPEDNDRGMSFKDIANKIDKYL